MNLENKNRINKNITEIKVEEDKTIKDPKKILQHVQEFYTQLYSNQDREPIEQLDIQPKRITNDERDRLDSPITKNEIDKALTQLKNNKSPGFDGYSAEFFKTFWPQLGHYFTNCVHECYENNSLSQSQTQGLITCLPKTGKACDLLKNWRPISLLNTTYKLISLCITNRLPNIISEEQKGFITGRSISDCTRIMYDIIFECENRGIDGLILLVDFEKAFDSLSWRFIHQVLKKYSFGNNFIKWINMFQQGSNSRIILNGNLSGAFNLHRGCRQGDPISPYLFILCSEYLTIAIKNNPEIEGIRIMTKEHKTSQYADDTSVYLKATERNLKKCLDTLEWFYHISGLKINIGKTKVIRIGPIRETDRRFCRENNLEWVSKYNALGIEYDLNNFQNITIQNIENKIESMKKLMHLWVYRNITPIGRVCILKSLILSKIIHVLQSLPTPNVEYMTKIEKLCINFIWKNKRHEVNKHTLCLPIEQGGLNMVNLKEFDDS